MKLLERGTGAAKELVCVCVCEMLCERNVCVCLSVACQRVLCDRVRTISKDVKILCTADDMAAVSVAMPTKLWDSAGKDVDVCASI